MNTLAPPPWPSGHRCIRIPVARLVNLPAPEETLRYGREDWSTPDPQRRHWRHCLAGFNTLSCAEHAVIFPGPFNAVASTASEAGILQATGAVQPAFPGNLFFSQPNRAFSVWGHGYFSTTGTPTLTFFFYLGTTQGTTTYTGTKIAASAAITSGSGVSNKKCSFRLDGYVKTPGQGTGNSTLEVEGDVWSPGGFASPFMYSLTAGGGDGTTTTATLDCALTQYFNASLTWSASSSSNTYTHRALYVLGLN